MHWCCTTRTRHSCSRSVVDDRGKRSLFPCLCGRRPQAAHLTSGLYFRPSHRSATLQYLVQCLAADTELRKMLTVQQTLGVDFRASCFCHKRAIEIGFVCSVCLAISCEQVKACPPLALCSRNQTIASAVAFLLYLRYGVPGPEKEIVIG